MSEKNGTPIDEFDLAELQEWRESIQDVLEVSGKEQVRRIIHEIDAQAQHAGVEKFIDFNTPYSNTIHVDEEVPIIL